LKEIFLFWNRVRFGGSGASRMTEGRARAGREEEEEEVEGRKGGVGSRKLREGEGRREERRRERRSIVIYRRETFRRERRFDGVCLWVSFGVPSLRLVVFFLSASIKLSYSVLKNARLKNKKRGVGVKRK